MNTAPMPVITVTTPPALAAPTGAQMLPPQQIETEYGLLTVTRAWPLPPEPEATGRTLALELKNSSSEVFAGFWQTDALQLLTPGRDPKLRALKQLLKADGAEIVSHRPAKRAVVRHNQGQGSVYTKVVKNGKATGILDGIRRAEPFAAQFRTPEILDSDESTVTFSALAGASLHNPAEFTAEQWSQAWAEVLEAWTAASSTTSRPTGSLIHRAEAEVGVLRHWLRLVEDFLPDRESAEANVEEIITQLQRLTEEDLRPTHRDLHDKQLLWSPDLGPGLLDLDTACLANPALDLGNLRAHALLRRLQGLWSSEQSETVQFCVDSAAESSAVSRGAVAVYERAALLRLGLVYAVRPQYADVAAELRQM
ncbi:phosphotransferase [Nesterenkonia sp. MY13]|uniref:Phosphotransferase n=1 Tax=Nesterenkonia sedimenti TaxID=1463632 RepID=A0A7X8TMH9_9MICC|nr:phosphotransferase [Nesterenkonia sedimenti]NLS11162.1 phosphotransferase [Nesterenkonia sedimenti]